MLSGSGDLASRLCAQCQHQRVRRIVQAPWLAVLLAISGCASGTVVSGTPSPSLSPSIASSPSPAPPTSFTSPKYGYTVMLPGGWRALEATVAWNGTSKTSSDTPNVDRWLSPTEASGWAYAAPFPSDLTAYSKKTVADTLKFHSSTCPPTPEAQSPIAIDGEPGVLLAYDCGILINVAVAVHHGVGYVFAMRDPSVPAATDPTDAAIFAGLLASVRFPAS